MPTNKEIFNEKMNALADSINEKAGTTGAKNLDDLKTTVDSIETGGADVVANPELQGDEDILVGLEVNNTKYKVDNFISSVPINDKTPYLLRTTAGGNDVGSKKKVKAIIGGTVAWNQLIKNGNFADSSEWIGGQYAQTSVSNNEMTVTLSAVPELDYQGTIQQSYTCIPNRVYLCMYDIYVSKPSTVVSIWLYTKNVIQINAGWHRIVGVVKENNTYAVFRIGITNAGTTGYEIGDTYKVKNVNLFDLTLMFGSTIADYVNTLETAQAGSGIAWLKSYGFFTKDYYPYNAGELLSVKTSANVMIGFNLYNNTTGKAVLIGGEPCQITGTYTALSYVDFSGNSETITPDSDGYFTPTNNGELTVTGGNATDTCVHFVYDGERDGEWEAYVKHSYSLDSDLEWRGIYKLDANNNIYTVGDKYEPDSTVKRNYGIVDLSTLTWTYTSNSYWQQSPALSNIKKLGGSVVHNIISDKYTTTFAANIIGNGAAGIGVGTSGNLICINGSSSETPSGYLVYEVATPTTESADSYDEEMDDSDWGIEYWVDDRDVPLPVGHDTDYEVNLKAKLEMTPNSPDVDGLYLVQHINGVNKYIQYVSPVPDLPSSNGTYTLKVTVSGSTKTVSWVSG